MRSLGICKQIIDVGAVSKKGRIVKQGEKDRHVYAKQDTKAKESKKKNDNERLEAWKNEFNQKKKKKYTNITPF